MNTHKILLAVICAFCAVTTALSQTTTPDIETIISKLNTETAPEPGCEQRVYALDNCTFSCSLTCGGQAFVLSFNLGDIERVYKDKADLEDTHETLFFECKKGKNCIMSDSDAIPPSPVFPVKLPEDPDSNLGDDMLKAFGELLAGCK